MFILLGYSQSRQAIYTLCSLSENQTEGSGAYEKAFEWFDGFDIRIPGITMKFKRPSKSYGTIAKEPSKVNNTV
jgi:hypothetical protein